MRTAAFVAGGVARARCARAAAAAAARARTRASVLHRRLVRDADERGRRGRRGRRGGVAAGVPPVDALDHWAEILGAPAEADAPHGGVAAHRATRVVRRHARARQGHRVLPRRRPRARRAQDAEERRAHRERHVEDRVGRAVGLGRVARAQLAERHRQRRGGARRRRQGLPARLPLRPRDRRGRAPRPAARAPRALRDDARPARRVGRDRLPDGIRRRRRRRRCLSGKRSRAAAFVALLRRAFSPPADECLDDATSRAADVGPRPRRRARRAGGARRRSGRACPRPFALET